MAAAKPSLRKRRSIAGRNRRYKVDIRSRDAIHAAIRATIAAFGGIDILVNTAALFPSSPDGIIGDDQWASTLKINVTANYILADEAAKIFPTRI